MSENGRDLVAKIHREAAEHYRVQKERERALVEAMVREAVEHYRENPPPPVDPPRGVHHTELPEAKGGEPLAQEWNTYRREVGRLLLEGQEGRHVLIKEMEIIGIFDSVDAAYDAGLKLYLGEPFFVHPIRAEEPHLRIRGINFPWPSSRFL